MGSVPRQTKYVELRNRIMAPVAVRDQEGNVTGADLGTLVRRLILFEQVVIDSFTMRELPALIDALGAEQFIALLESGVLSIRADAWAFGEMGDGGWLPGDGGKPLPPLSYAFTALVPADRKDHISLCLEEIRKMPLGKKTSKKLRNAIVDSLVPFPEGAGRETLAALPSDLTLNLGLVRAAVRHSLTEKLGAQVEGAAEFKIEVEQEGEDIFIVKTDIEDVFGLSAEEADKAVQDGLLAIGSLNQRLEEMESYNAVTGFKEPELVYAKEKFGFLIDQVDPDKQEERFGRVVELAGLPNPATSPGTVNVEKLLEARESSECREFRLWVRTLDGASDDEVKEQTESVGAQVAAAIQSTTGKIVRFAATTGIGLVPGVGQIAGPALRTRIRMSGASNARDGRRESSSQALLAWFPAQRSTPGEGQVSVRRLRPLKPGPAHCVEVARGCECVLSRRARVPAVAAIFRPRQAERLHGLAGAVTEVLGGRGDTVEARMLQ